MRGRSTRTNRAPNQHSRAAADQSTYQRSSGRSSADFDLVPPLVTRTLKLSFFVHISSPDIGIHQHRVEHEALPIGHDQMLGKERNGRFALNPSWLIEFGDASFDRRAHRNHCLAVNHNRLRDLSLKPIAHLTAEG